MRIHLRLNDFLLLINIGPNFIRMQYPIKMREIKIGGGFMNSKLSHLESVKIRKSIFKFSFCLD